MLWNGFRMRKTRELVCWLALSIQGANRCWVSEWINSEIWLLHTGPRPCCLPPRVQPPHMMQHQRQDAIMISCHVPPHWETTSCFGIQNTQVAHNLSIVWLMTEIHWEVSFETIGNRNLSCCADLTFRSSEAASLWNPRCLQQHSFGCSQVAIQSSQRPSENVEWQGGMYWWILVIWCDLRESAKNPEWSYRCIQKWYHRDWKQHPSPNWGTQAFTWSWLVQPLVDPTL